MPRLSSPTTLPSAADRKALRRPVAIGLVVSSSALGHLTARALDLSLGGCRIVLQCRMTRGQFVMLTFPGFSPIGGRVAWSDGVSSGITFDRPLAVSVLHHLLAQP
ncbi:PilZ domain-containing protein [Sphingomonas rubra]|uniref:PilZ domain-containing protein n=1 Tax=Sphingomonas rubra TaxID=634430 RepID=A0A1I5RAN2_9SPHN|nr:PilZ domain-containing protein [Sphingomonas rubra]SFP55563.1 PilZ domain-containing protein [Sphingomonas rubra]